MLWIKPLDLEPLKLSLGTHPLLRLKHALLPKPTLPIYTYIYTLDLQEMDSRLYSLLSHALHSLSYSYLTTPTYLSSATDRKDTWEVLIRLIWRARFIPFCVRPCYSLLREQGWSNRWRYVGGRTAPAEHQDGQVMGRRSRWVVW
jgi:hypothetical protein